MKWIKFVFNFLFKKNIVKQGKISQEIIDKFAQLLDDALNFEKILGGKLAFLEKYDKWLFAQIISGFVALFGDKFADDFWTKFEVSLHLFNTGQYEQASNIITKEISKKINTGIAKDAEELIIQKQLSLLMELASIYMKEEGDTDKKV